jgi:serine/threonine protein kinase
MIQILSGLCLCHERSICHRDLTLSNSMALSWRSLSLVMFVKVTCKCHQSHSSQRRWVITDFGFAMRIDDDTVVLSHRKRGTNTYRAPELIQKCEASKKSDIWALFITPRLNANHNKTLIQPMGRGNSTPFWQHLNSVLGDCFAFDPKERPTAHDLKLRFEDMRSVLLDSETVGPQPYELESSVPTDNQEPNAVQCNSVH